MVSFLDNLITRSDGHLFDIAPRPVARYETLLGEQITLPVAEDEVEEDVNVFPPSPTQPAPKAPRLPKLDPSAAIVSPTSTLHNSSAPRPTPVEKIIPPLQPPTGSAPTQSTQQSSPTDIAANAIEEKSETFSEKSGIEPLSPQPNETIIDSRKVPLPDEQLFFPNPPIPDNQLSESAVDPESKIVPAQLPDDELNPNHNLHTIVRPEAMTASASVSLPESESIIPTEQISSSAAQPLPTVTESPSTIEITIGRIEVRANQTVKPNARSQSTAKPKSPVMSLADYLKARSDGGGG